VIDWLAGFGVFGGRLFVEGFGRHCCCSDFGKGELAQFSKRVGRVIDVLYLPGGISGAAFGPWKC
jgi:hypothetical protein